MQHNQMGIQYVRHVFCLECTLRQKKCLIIGHEMQRNKIMRQRFDK
jgi:hypothetical protein